MSAAAMTSPPHGTPKRPDHARVNPSHRHRILTAIHPEPLQTHSQITRWPSHITTPRTTGRRSNTTGLDTTRCLGSWWSTTPSIAQGPGPRLGSGGHALSRFESDLASALDPRCRGTARSRAGNPRAGRARCVHALLGGDVPRGGESSDPMCECSDELIERISRQRTVDPAVTLGEVAW